MPDIAPFKAYYFDAKNQAELEKFVAPPHDIISPAERIAYLQKSPDNIVHIILPESYPKAGAILNNLIENGKLTQVKSPAFYLYKTKNLNNGVMLERYGLLTLVKITKFSKKQIMPHEKIFRKIAEGRLKLFRETQANFNPIFFLFNGNPTFVKIFKKYVSKPPLLKVCDRDKVEHTIWVIDGTHDIKALQESFKKTPLLIADGHHRYASSFKLSRKKGSKYVFGLLVDMHDPNLRVFPTHRLVRYVSEFSTSAMLPKLKEHFNLEVYDFSIPNMMDQLAEVLERLNEKGQYAFGLFLYGIESFFILTLREKFLPNSLIKGRIPDALKELDVSLLHEFVFKLLLKIPPTVRDSEKSLENILYLKTNLEEAVNSVYNGLYQAVFILKPTKMEQILQITQAKKVMPQKSTWFYPKPLSGLLIYKWAPTDIIEPRIRRLTKRIRRQRKKPASPKQKTKSR
jgi:uncharacterized protein (DUF1015 family)